MCQKNVFNTFINNNHWILVKIHTSTLNLHCAIYDSHKIAQRHNPIIMQTYVNSLLYTCKCNATNRQLIMWCFHNSIHNKHHVWIWSQKILICLTQMQTHLQKSIKNRYIFPFPKYELIWHIYPLLKNNSLSQNNSSQLVEWSSAEPKYTSSSRGEKERS